MAREVGGASSLDNAVFFLHLGRARESLRAGKLEEARRELELARLSRPDDADLLNLVSIVEFRRGDFAEAARAGRALVDSNPASAVLHANLGLIHFKAGNLAQARQELNRAIDLDPDHARSHLYLGLLDRGRGELPSALEHFRRAGAKKAATEVEQALRAPSGRPPLKVLPPPSEPPAFRRAAVGELAAPAPPAHGFSDLGSQNRPLFDIRADGTVRVSSPGLVYVRRATVAWYSGRIRFVQEPAFAGTKLESLLKAEGAGDLLLAEPGKRGLAREAAGGQTLYLDAGRVLALAATLKFRVQPILDLGSRRRVDLLRIQGRGGAVLSIAGSLEAHDVSPDFPLSLSSKDLIAWTGDLLPAVVDDRFLDEVMRPAPSNAPKLRFEGEGVVLSEAPTNLLS